MSGTARRALLGLFGAAALAGQGLAQPAGWPQRTVRLLVPYATGGGTDILARALAEALRPQIGQAIVVENRPAANGVVGSEYLARAEPDGLLLGVVTATHTLNKYALTALPYDPIGDFTAVSLLTRQTQVLVTGMQQPWRDVAELIAAARAAPGSIGFGQTEAATAYAGHQFERLAGVQMVDVPYRGGALLMNDVIAGHLPVGWTSTGSVSPFLAGGQARVLAVTSATRSPLLPDVPTLQEAGVAGYEFSGWVGVFGPPGMPAALAEHIAALLARAMGEPALAARLPSLGIEPDVRGPAAFAEFLRRDDARWAQAARDGLIVRQQ